MNIKSKTFISIIILASLIIASISLYEILSNEEDKIKPLRFSSKTLLENGATKEGVNNVISSYNQFTFDLYHEITDETNENVFFSPFSIYIALSMTYEGARENTSYEIADVLHYPNDDEIRRGSFAKIQNDINNRKAKCTLELSNNVWIQEGLQVKDDFVYNIDNYYFADINELNFLDDPEESRKIINQWVDKETGGKIKDFLPPNSIDTETVMALTNAIYFSGDWKHAFEKENTKDEKFYLENNQTNMVPMMNINPDDYESVEFNIFNNETIQVIELPYKGDTISMFIFLPKKMSSWRYYNLEDDLSFEYYYEAIGKLTPWDEITVKLPKFSFVSEYKLKSNLKTMGMEEAFNESANFSGITDECPLWIDEVYHEASITVNEKGTEATASSSVTASTGIPPEFNANHPFFFTIQDKETGLILFMGRVMNP